MSARPDRPVSTIMSWPVATIDHVATLEEAAEALAAGIGARSCSATVWRASSGMS